MEFTVVSGKKGERRQPIGVYQDGKLVATHSHMDHEVDDGILARGGKKAKVTDLECPLVEKVERFPKDLKDLPKPKETKAR